MPKIIHFSASPEKIRNSARNAPGIAVFLMLLGLMTTAPQVLAAPSENAGATIQEALLAAKDDVRRALAKLNATHKAIADETGAVTRQIEELRNDVAALKDEVAGKRTQQAQLNNRIEQLSDSLRRKGELLTYSTDLLTEYRRQITTSMTGASAGRYMDRLDEIDRLLASEDESDWAAASEQLLQLGIANLEAALGGRRFEGTAKKSDGTVVAGEYAEFGPVAFFKSTGKPPVAGLAIESPGGLTPVVVAPPSGSADSFARLFKDEHVSLTFDPTLGSAIRLHQARDTLWGHLQKGRIVIIPLLLLGGVCAVIALYKLLQLTGLTTAKAGRQMQKIIEAIEAGRVADAELAAGKLRRPLAAVIREGIRHREAPKEHLEEIMYERLIAQTPILERLLAPLAVCASAAPLLGLLGTVTGMIHTFKLITVFGTGDAKLLSSGISEALITTEVGLIIAVPALLIHAYLSRRVRRAISLTQQAATEFINRLKLRFYPESTDEDDG